MVLMPAALAAHEHSEAFIHLGQDVLARYAIKKLGRIVNFSYAKYD
jgi:hypothetical protein